MKFMSRTGHRPFVRKQAPSNAAPVRAGAEFSALLRIMHESNFDLLAMFYGGARLTYDQSVSQKIMFDVGRRVTSRVSEKLPPGRVDNIVRKITRKIATQVMKEESQYVIDNITAQAVDFAVGELESVIEDLASKSIPVIGLLKSGYDAFKTDLDALDKIIRASCAKKHASKVRAGSPRAAAQSVATIMKRKAVFTSISGASSTGAFAGGVAAEAGSFGALTGTAEVATAVVQAFVDLIVWMVEMVMDIMDFRRGQALLEDLEVVMNPDQQFFTRLFNDCPVLGCYMLATPIFPTSAFVWLVTTEGNVASVDEINRVAIKHVNPLRLEASWIISEASFTMANSENATVNTKIQQAVRESRADATKRTEALDKTLMQKLIDYSTEGRGNHMPGFGVVGDHGGFGTHNYQPHQGKLAGLSEKLRRFKKTTRNHFVTQTRAGRYFKRIGVMEEG